MSARAATAFRATGPVLARFWQRTGIGPYRVSEKLAQDHGERIAKEIAEEIADLRDLSPSRPGDSSIEPIPVIARLDRAISHRSGRCPDQAGP
jgi:hypothetical protein